MEGNTFFVVDEKELTTGKCAAYAIKVPKACNLFGYFKPMKGFGIVSINACSTWKEAQDIARQWNDGARERGNYAFG